ncbi:hypothetical protein Taro_003381 [Colocasia esculenta]|uniref:Late embryogenesis abundant protein LEA-2 subgroup domain-containing protein n=1 Tax=Colocasia esculenta TaxID=4460 RepID=A0A843TJ42_COLES|nr:hypothetical protein [Colocasia esculenta]
MAKPGVVYAEVEEPFVLPRHDHKTLSTPSPPLYGDYPEDLPVRPYLLIPLYGDRPRRSTAFPRRRAAGCCDALLSRASLHALLLAGLVLGVASFLLWPSGPEVRLVHMKLKSVKVSSKQKGTLVALDIALDLKVRVRNRAFFALGYDNVTVGIEYRGRPLGTAMALGGIVEARGVTYAAAKMRLDGIRVLEDALFLIEDLLKGNIPFETVTMVDGDLRFFSFNLPIQRQGLWPPHFGHFDTSEDAGASSIAAMAKPGATAADVAEEPLLLPPQHPPPAPCYGIPVDQYQAAAAAAATPPPPYLIIPVSPGRSRRRRRNALLCLCLLALLTAALLLGAAVFLFWPCGPDVRLAHVHLRSIRVSPSRHGGVAVDVDVRVKALVHNPNAFSLRYEGVIVEVGYRGRRLGWVVAGGAVLRARASSYVKARVRVEGVWVVEDTAYLIEDMARGRIPLDAVARVKGRIHLLSVGIPIKGRISCAINVDVENQLIASQDCYPEKEELRILEDRTSIYRYCNLMAVSLFQCKARPQRHLADLTKLEALGLTAHRQLSAHKSELWSFIGLMSALGYEPSCRGLCSAVHLRPLGLE